MNFNNMIKKITLFAVLLFVVGGVHAQTKKGTGNEGEEKSKQLPSVALGLGFLMFNGDIGAGIDVTSLSSIRGGYYLTVEQRVGRVIGVSFNGIYGKFSESESTAKRNLNFQSNIIQADLNLALHFDNGFIMERNSAFAPYLYVGFGYLKFNSYGDLKDKNGVNYNYWTDGTIRDLPDSTAGASILQRDYTYETKLNDSSKYADNSFALPLGLGVNLKLSDRLYVKLNATYYMTMTDWIDDVKAGKNDSYIFTSFGLQYNFSIPDDDSDPKYETVDFSSLDKLDSDGDGVKDGVDACPGTPAKVKVTSDGCPEDNDKDGVADHLDKEPLTKAGALVDEKGVTLTEKMLADRQKEFEALATERSNLFNENPSLGYLKDVESKFMNKGGTKNSESVPAPLRSADLNSDGLISTEEIARAIDSFFEGDSDLSVEKLNDLIDYFFEQ